MRVCVCMYMYVCMHCMRVLCIINYILHIYVLCIISTQDFSYEVRRSLMACSGALLLVDCAQGIQAQTLATHRAAVQEDLQIIPVLTKIDLPNSNPEDVMLSMAETFNLDPDGIVLTSAKSGDGIFELFDKIIDEFDPPSGKKDSPLRVRIVDSWYDQYRGVISLVEITDGILREGDQITPLARSGFENLTVPKDARFEVQELGILLPEKRRTGVLNTGQVGYLVCGMWTTKDAIAGDTIIRIADKPKFVKGSDVSIETGHEIEPLSGFVMPKSMVFASIYPVDDSSFEDLRTAIEKLTLNDASVSINNESSDALGMGFRCGFLGLLHMEVFNQRLRDEHDMPVMITAPTVPYEIHYDNGDVFIVQKAGDFPADGHKPLGAKILEPFVLATIICPADYLGGVLELLNQRRGVEDEMSYIEGTRVILKYYLPWQEVISDFFDHLKNSSSGYASFDYEESPPRLANVCRVDMKLNGKLVDALSFICIRADAERIARETALKLKEKISRQLYEVNIQGAIGSKIVAKERVAPYRKDVLMKSGKLVGGGDVTRKKKLLERQKKGKKALKTIGNVSLSPEAFLSVFNR